MNKTPRKAHPVILAIALAAAMGGCAGIKGPNWLHPGTIEQQRKEAQRFDPYPDNQIATPVVGGRPRDFTDPIPEPERARWPVPGVRP